MKYTIDVAYKSLFKYGEELCGDKVAVARTENSTICVLADGLGSGVKANILSTLSSQIIVTMLKEGATMEEAVETIAGTLPVCSVRKVAYSTFSVLQITDEGEAYLVEFDNPFCIYVRDGKLVQLPCVYREYAGKGMYESRFNVLPGDSLTIVSDGVIYAGVGATLNFGWTWDSVAEWLTRTVTRDMSALRLSTLLSQAVSDLYMGKCGDDSTVMAVKVLPRKSVNLLASPPKDKDKDEQMVRDFMKAMGKKVVCGGSSANMVGRVLPDLFRPGHPAHRPDRGHRPGDGGRAHHGAHAGAAARGAGGADGHRPLQAPGRGQRRGPARAAAARGLHAPSPLRGHGGQPRAPEPEPARGSDDQVQAYR